MASKHGVFFSLAVSAVMLSQPSTIPVSRYEASPPRPVPPVQASRPLPPPATAQQPDSLRPVVAGVRGHVIQLFFKPEQPVKAGQLLAKVSEEVAGSSQYTVAFVVAPADGVMAEARLQPGDFHQAKSVLALLRIPLNAPLKAQ